MNIVVRSVGAAAAFALALGTSLPAAAGPHDPTGSERGTAAAPRAAATPAAAGSLEPQFCVVNRKVNGVTRECHSQRDWRFLKGWDPVRHCNAEPAGTCTRSDGSDWRD